FTANWKVYANAIDYRLDISTSPTFSKTKNNSITENFNGGIKSLAGWGVSNHIKTDTSVFGASSPSLEFMASNAQVETPELKEPANQLKFWIRGLNTSQQSSLLVEG